MIAPAREILILSPKNKKLLLEVFSSERSRSNEVENLRVQFRDNRLYMVIFNDVLASAFLRFITGEIQEDDEVILELKEWVLDVGGDFPSSITAMMQIIREELNIE